MVDETLLYRVFAYKQICFLLCKLECEREWSGKGRTAGFSLVLAQFTRHFFALCIFAFRLISFLPRLSLRSSLNKLGFLQSLVK